MNEETLTADVSNKLQQLGALVDNDLPKYIVKLILNQHSIERIQSELSLFLDAVNTPFIEWLDVYLKNSDSNASFKKEKLEVISAAEIEEEQLDFEEEEPQQYLDDSSEMLKNENELSDNEIKNENQLEISTESKNKRKLEQDNNDESSKKLMNNDREAVRMSSQNVIKLTNNSHLNDIGQMRRKAMQEQKTNLSQQSLTPHTINTNVEDDDDQSADTESDGYRDLRDKLNSRKKERQDDDQTMETNDMPADDEDEKKERCKFWPFCKKEAECIFAHPTEQCKLFPSCKLGADKCLNIHPLCKFDALCTKKDCPFLHITKRQQQIILPPVQPTHLMHVECKFFPNCYNNNCPFIHPKLCMYGAMCKNPICTFKHIEQTSSSSNVAKPHQLKWTKSSNSDLPATNDVDAESNLIIKNENVQLDEQLNDEIKDELDDTFEDFEDDKTEIKIKAE